MAKKGSTPVPVEHVDESDHSHPVLPLLMVAVLVVALLALALKAFGII